MTLTNETKQFLFDTLERLDKSVARQWNANEYESGLEEGHDRLLENLRDTLGLQKCVDCGVFLEPNQQTFCTKHRELFQENKRKSQY
jgi:hypothetical protein